MDSDSFSNCTNDHAAHARNPLMIAVIMRVKVKTLFFIFIGKKLEKTSIEICLFWRTARLAPKNPVHKTNCLKRISPQTSVWWNRFLATICPNDRMIIKDKRQTINRHSKFSRVLSIELRELFNFIGNSRIGTCNFRSCHIKTWYYNKRFKLGSQFYLYIPIDYAFCDSISGWFYFRSSLL